ncbi:MAG: hypothetical protein IPM85_11060 [Chitinophagaceae bacterium]|nr:hypothetical protein [Chitinophagaceae bacterium]
MMVINGLLEVVQEFFSSYDQDVLDKIVLGIAVAKDKENGFIFTPDKHKSFGKEAEVKTSELYLRLVQEHNNTLNIYHGISRSALAISQAISCMPNK